MKRRSFLVSGTAAGLAAGRQWFGPVREAEGAARKFKYAICNELFEKRDFAAQCRAIRTAGFQGIEIAPFTLADHLDEISAARRRELRDIIGSEGIEFAGLHWLLITPKGLHLTTADPAVRQKSWEYILKLIDFCADLGKGILVLGSPKQRGAQGNTPAEARKLLRDGLAKAAPHAARRGCTILIEALPGKDTDVVNTLGDAVAMVEEVNHPGVRTMFDFHNTPDETEASDALVRRFFRQIRHVHVNEMDGRYPGSGTLDFLPVFKALADLKYSGWISIEVFDFKPSPEHILGESMSVLRKLEARL